jgi:hypothetical protein
MYIYNPTDQRRIQIVKVLIDTYQVHITSNNQIINSCQIDPKWTGRKSNMMEKNMFEVRLKIFDLIELFCFFLSISSFLFLLILKLIH